jgi:hypothetical protein
MAQQRRRVKHTATFEKRLAERQLNLRKPQKSNLPAARRENCFCGARPAGRNGITHQQLASARWLSARRVDGIHLAPFEEGEIGPELFRHACLMGLEGLVSKHRESPYRAGRFDRWIKVKNRQHAAFSRVMDQF